MLRFLLWVKVCTYPGRLTINASYMSDNLFRRKLVDCVWNVMAHAQKKNFVFRRNWRVHLNLRGRQCSRLLAVEVCASAVVMLDTPCSEVVWRYWLPTPFASFPRHFPSRGSPCDITFQLDPTYPSRLSIPPVSRLESLIGESTYMSRTHEKADYQLKVITSSVSEEHKHPIIRHLHSCRVL